jgi:hypothetical protein
MTAKKKANKKPRSREGRNTPGGKNRVRKRTVESERSRSFAGQRSGDVVGLSNVERADSESVEELLEEGNSFEAGVVKGVEDAEDADETEVRTHQVPQDDVPDEYQDKDQAPSALQRRLAGKSDHINGRPRVAT